MPTEIQKEKTQASQPLLPKWANAQDGWCRAIASDVLKNGVQGRWCMNRLDPSGELRAGFGEA